MVFAKRLRLPAICLLTVAANPSHALAWSDLGHKVVCEIAYTPSSLVEMMITLDGANTKIAFDANDSVTLTGFVRTIGQACSVVQSGATGSKCCVIMSGRAGPGRFRPPGMNGVGSAKDYKLFRWRRLIRNW